MKRLLFVMSFLFVTFTNVTYSAKNHFAVKQQTFVYICTGKYAKVYHSTAECGGLRNCKADIIKVTLDDAINKYGRRPCKECE